MKQRVLSALLSAAVITGSGVAGSLAIGVHAAHAVGGSITIVENSLPDDAQDFDFITDAGPSPFQLDDDADGTLLNSVTFDNLDDGAYFVAQDPGVPDWMLTSLVCSTGGRIGIFDGQADIEIVGGNSVTCTYTNTKLDPAKATLTIAEDTNPKGPQDFAFTTTGAGLPSFSLDDDTDPTLPNTRVFANLDPADYTVTEGPVAGWKLDDIVCDGSNGDVPTRKASITLVAGDDIRCTFLNSVPPIAIDNGIVQLGLNATADLNVPFDVVSSGGTSELGIRFLPTGAEATAPGCLCEGWGVADSLTDVAGYANEANGTDNLQPISQVVTPSTAVLVNQVGTTFLVTHDYHPSSNPNLYEVTVTIKNISNASTNVRYRRVMDWDVEPTAFSEYVTLERGNATELVFTSDDGFASSNPLAPQSSIAFTGEAVDSGPADHGALFDFDFGVLAPNAEKTFETYYGAGATEAQVLGALGSVGAEAYSLGQPSTADGPTLGTPNTFTFGFTDIGGQPALGSITIKKDAVPDNGTDFSFTTTGNGLSPFSLDDDADPTLANEKTFTGLLPGTYSVTEGAGAGTLLSGLTCDTGGVGDTGTRTATITLTEAAHVTCTYTNTTPGSITIVKDAVPNSATDYAFTTSGTGLAPFSLDDDADPTLSNSKTFSGLLPGPYTVTEAADAGTALTGLECSTGGSGNTATRVATINLVAGANVICTFTNSQVGSITIVKDALPDAGVDFPFATTGTGLTPFSLDDDADPTLPNTTTFTGLLPGPYSITESAVPTWALTGLDCSTGGNGNTNTRVATINLVAGAHVTCTFTNTKLGSITITKDASPDSPVDFGFTTTGTGLTPFSLDDDADPTLPNTTTFTGLLPGPYTVTESLVGNWKLTGLNCSTGGSGDTNTRVATINLVAGANVTCTFANTKLSSITIVKDALPDAGVDFGFTTTGTGLTPFSLDDDADPTLSNTTTFSGLLPGSYSVTESLVGNWKLTGLNCTTGGSGNTNTRVATINLVAGADVTCTYTNTKLGSITIVKDASPDSPVDFGFTTSGTGLTPFSLDDDADPTLSNTTTFTGLLPGPYSVTEGLVANWALTGLDCTTGGNGNTNTRVATINLVAGADVTCTFTNTEQNAALGSITIVKDALPDAGVDFGFTTSGTGLTPFSLDDDADPTLSNTTTFTGLLPGPYSVTETAVPNWALTGLDCSTGGSGNTNTRVATINLVAGADVTCTYTNTKLGSITITKDASPDSPVDFGFTTSGTGLTPFSLDDDADPTLSNSTTFSGLLPGPYSVTEGLVANWSLTGLDCSTGGNGNTNTRVATINLAAGADVTCTFTNTKLGSITITKDAIPDAGVDFPFTTTGTGLAPFSLDDDADPTLPNTTTFTGLLPGPYSITESLVGNWKLTGLDCSTGGSGNSNTRVATINLAAGANVTCTYTNTKLGSITINKDALPDAGVDFGFTTTGTGLTPFSLDDDADPTLSNTTTFNGLLPGPYSVTEGLVANWALTGLDCSTGGSGDTNTRVATINLVPGADVTCKFTNTKLGSITITKDASPDSPVDFGFTTSGTGLTPFALDDDADPTLANTTVFGGLMPGPYTVTEGVVAGWKLTGLDCSTGGTGDTNTRVATINLVAGADVTCTFTNTKLGSITINKDASPDSPVDFGFTTSGTGLTPFSLDDDADPALSNTTTFNGLLPGPYSVTEGLVANWALTGLDCSTGGSGNTNTRVATINLVAGADVTCTFTNTEQNAALGSITINKDALPDAGVDFGFTTSGTGLAPFSLDDDADPTLPNTTTFTGLLPGPYSVTEALVTNWKLTGLDCSTGGSGNTDTRTATINLTAGADVTCTFTNTKLGSITINKDASPDSPVDFGFTTTGTGLAPFSLDDDADPTLANTTAFGGLMPGPYTVTEGVVAGWKLTGLDCSTGGTGDTNTRVATINLVAGADVTCTFTNTEQNTALGSITIVKDALPDAGVDFPFTTSGAGLAPFSLDDDADPTLPSTITFTGLLPGSYRVTEGVVAGWKLTGLTCSAGGIGGIGGTGTRLATINLVAGANVTCTFTNTRLGSITIVKDALPDAGVDFGFTTTGTGLAPFSLDDDADPTLPNTTTFTGLLPGPYSVTEALVTNWKLTGLDCTTGGNGDTNTRTATITLTAGADVTCTYTNTKLGSITINKDASPDSPVDFGFTTTGTGLAPFSLDDDADPALTNTTTFTGLLPGPYSVTEALVTDWKLTGLDCSTGGNGDTNTRTATINLTAGANVTCTFTNTFQGTGEHTITALSDAHLWVGLRNGDDKGTRFDVRVELIKNGVPVATGLTRCVNDLAKNKTKATAVVVHWDPFSPVTVESTDAVALRISTRIGTNPNGTKCAGPGGSHNNAAGLRFYYDATNRDSHFGATIGNTPDVLLYTHSDGGLCDKPKGKNDSKNESENVTTRFLDSIAPTARKARCKDSAAVNFAGGNPFRTVGDWRLPPRP